MPNNWSETRVYDAAGQLIEHYKHEPTNAPNKTVAYTYKYDKQGNVKREKRTGGVGLDDYDLKHRYDELNRLTATIDKEHNNPFPEYEYDSLGNLVYEKTDNNKGVEYWYNVLNQQVKKVVDGSNNTGYEYKYDKRGNLIEGIKHQPGNPSQAIVEEYTYDATNRMVKGVNEKGEESHYIYNGLGYLIANEWVIVKNAYGYPNNSNVTPNDRVGDVVVCDRHSNSTGQGHINPTGKGHTTGGTTGGSAPSIPGNMIVVHKDYTLDYTSALRNVIMEEEYEAGILTYRYVYGLEKAHVVIYGIGNNGNLIQPFSSDPDPTASTVTYAMNEYGEWIFESSEEFPLSDIMETYDYSAPGTVMPFDSGSSAGTSIVKLIYHHDRLGSVDFLTSNVDGKSMSYVSRDDWGQPDLKKMVLNTGSRELNDLVLQYTVHPYDLVLDAYYAQARMYDAADRRFMAMDLIGNNLVIPRSSNRYAYVWDNPLCFIDLLGLDPKKVNGSITINRGSTTNIISSVYQMDNVVYVDFFEALIAYGIEGVPRGVYGTISTKQTGTSNSVKFAFDNQKKVASYTIIYTRGRERGSVEGNFYAMGAAANQGYTRHLVTIDYFKRLMNCLGRKAETVVNLSDDISVKSGNYVSIPAKISEQGLQFLINVEGYRSHPYVGQDYKNITIGVGNAILDGVQKYNSLLTQTEKNAIIHLKNRVDSELTFNNVVLDNERLMNKIRSDLNDKYGNIISSSGLWITETEAKELARIRCDLEFESAVNTFLGRNPQVKITQYQFDALVSFAYTFGGAYFTNTGTQKGDTIRDFLTAGDYSLAASKTAFMTYTGSDLSRREREATLFSTGK